MAISERFVGRRKNVASLSREEAERILQKSKTGALGMLQLIENAMLEVNDDV